VELDELLFQTVREAGTTLLVGQPEDGVPLKLRNPQIPGCAFAERPEEFRGISRECSSSVVAMNSVYPETSPITISPWSMVIMAIIRAPRGLIACNS
jgi:hypothetical protein